jgi:hypothetical protein
MLGAVVLGLAATAPAAADSNFERGFEDQLGRIAAVEAVNLGKHVLLGGVGAYSAHAGYEVTPVRYVADRRHRGGRHVGRHAGRHWRHDRGLHLGHWKHRGHHGRHRGWKVKRSRHHSCRH